MHILAELDTQGKALLKRGGGVPSHMVEPSFEELMASAFWFMVEFLAPQGSWHKRMEADMCSIPLPTTADKLHGIR
jgi:hypothetical protein